MGYRGRIYFTEKQKAEIWDRWQRGESMSSIGRMFDRNSSSIYPLLSRTGGIRPPERKRSRLALRLSEREEISRGHCQTNQSGPAKGAGLRRSGRQLTPLGQGDRAVLFEDIATVEVTVVVEVVVDRGMGSGKLLEGLHVPELRHRSFSSSERLV
jgi:hypothetical protein